MASKRPSKVSIKARQRNIIEGTATRGLTSKQAAKEFGVTLRQYKTFTGTKNLRPNFSRSPAYAKLYRAGERKETHKVKGTETYVLPALGTIRIPRYDYKHLPTTNTVLTNKQLEQEQIKVRIRYLYYKNGQDKAEWSRYVVDHNLPSSIDTLKLLHDNDKISDTQFGQILASWQDIYNISDKRFDQITGDVNIEAF